jgi:mannan endo-1,4-beta-mannosidase
MPPVSVDELNERLVKMLDRIEPYYDEYFPESGPTPPDPGPPDNGTYARPPESKGTGCFVAVDPFEGRHVLCDGNGKPFRIRGTCKCHQDLWSPPLHDTKSNATRWIARQEPWIPYSAAGFIERVKEQPGGLPSHCIQIPGFWEGTCESDGSLLNEMVNTWIEGIADYTTIETFMILNIANEWGNDHTAWKNAYIAAIQRLRNAGWHGCLMIDAPGCGQDGSAIPQYGPDIFASDPEHNIIFSWHIYGAVYDSQGGVPESYPEQVDLVPTMDAIHETGLCAVIGEFGPGENIGASPTPITPQRIVTLAEERGFGWLSWSWDDNNQSNAQADDNSFCHVYDGITDALGENLTEFGVTVTGLWDQYGATKATVDFPAGSVREPPPLCDQLKTPRFERRHNHVRAKP